MSSPKKYQIAIPHQQDLPSERVRKAFRDVNAQFDQIATDVASISTQVSTLQTTTTGLTTPPVQVLPSIQPIAQPAGGGGGAPADQTYVTVTAEGAALPNSRQLAAGAGISLTDAGAGSTLTIAATGSSGYVPQTTAVTPVTVNAGPIIFRGTPGAGADQVANLPAATGSGVPKIIKKLGTNAHSIVVTANGGDLIDGLGTYTVGPTQYAAITIVDGAAGVWDITDVKP